MILSIVVGALASALIASLLYAVRVVPYRNHLREPVASPQAVNGEMLGMYKDIDANKDAIANLLIAVSEGIARVDRHEKRISKTVTSARRLVREAGLEHAGIEAEHAELQSADAEGSEPLPPMPALVEETRTIRIPGGSLEIGAA